MHVEPLSVGTFVHGRGSLDDASDARTRPLFLHEEIMRARESGDPSPDCLTGLLQTCGISQGLCRNRLDHRERVLHAVRKFSDQETLVFLGLLPLCGDGSAQPQKGPDRREKHTRIDRFGQERVCATF